MTFPINRMRRLRANETIRSMVRETKIDIKDLIYPLFITFGKDVKKPVQSMPGIFQLSADNN